MAGYGFGDFPPPREEQVEKEALSRSLPVEDADEASFVSASLFKEMTSEEEMEEIPSGNQNQIRIGKEGNSHNEIPNADTEGDSSGEEGSLFDDIAGEGGSQYGAHLAAHLSGYVGPSHRASGACHGLYCLEGGITDEVPFISTGQRDLDDIGSLPSDLGLLRGKEDGCVSNFELNVEKGERESDGQMKHEVSRLAGISRDYGNSSGEEGCEDGGLISLADNNVDESQNSTLVVPLNPPNQPQDSLWSGKVSTMAVGIATISGEDKTPGAGELNEVQESGPYDALDGQDRTFTSDTPKERVRKRGRAARELGALLMDSNSGRRGKWALELQGASGQTNARELADAFTASDGVGVPSTGLGSIGEVRITRSQVSGRSAVKDEGPDSKVPESRVPADIAARRTGKRSVTRGGRLGWGNVSEPCQQGLEVVPNVEDKSPAVSEGVGEEYFVPVGLPPSVHADEEPVKSNPKGKTGGRAKKSCGQGKAVCVDNTKEVQLDSKEIVTTGPLTGRVQDTDGSEVVINGKIVYASPSVDCVLQDAVCTLNSEETEVLDVETAMENNNLGRRRSNRQVAKAGEKVEVGQHASYSGKVQKNSKERKRASTSGNTTESLDLNFKNENLKNGEDITEPLSAPQEITTNVGDSGNGAGSHDFPARRSTGRKLSKGKTNADGLVLGKKEEGSAVCGRPPNMGNVKSGGRSKVKQGDTELALVGSVNLEGACVKRVTLTGDDSAGADQRSDKNTSSITGETKEVCHNQKKIDNLEENMSIEIRYVETAQCLWRTLDAKDGCVRNTDTCNSSACVDSSEQFPEESNKTLINSLSTVKLENAGGNEDAPTRGVGVSQEEVENRQEDLSIPGKGGNGEGDRSRNFRDDAGSATSCDRLEKKEGEFVGPDQGITASLGLPDSRGRGDLEINGTSKFAEPGEVKGSGNARTRQRRVAQEKAGAKLGAQPRSNGKKGCRKKDSVGPSVPQENVVSSGSKKKKVGACRDKKKPILETGGRDLPDANKGVAVPETSKIADPVDVVDVVQKGGLEEMHGVKMSLKEVEKLACSGYDVDVAQRQNIGVSAEGCLTSKPSSTRDVDSEKCKSSSDSRLVTGAKSSRNVKVGQKKSKKSLVSGLEGIASRAKSKNESRRSSRAKGTTVKALLSVNVNDRASACLQDERINSVNGSHMSQSGGSTLPSVVKCDVGNMSARVRSPNHTDAMHGLEAVQNSLKGSQVSGNIDSPEDIGAVGEDMSSGVTEGEGSEEIERRAEAGVSEADIPRKSWVLCDDCSKWRCIPVELADQIDDTNAKWSCRDNPNPDYADCSVPQEKSNAEINAELQISEVSASDEGDDKDGIESKLMEFGTGSGENKPAVWTRIRRNIFQHRRAKSQASDEIMVCQCTRPEDGGVGCGDNCLNRVLNIECVQEHCPCGESCSNQQFQKRMYAPVETFRCGKKGFGLKVLKNILKDSFLIEYVGEVLDVGAFEERQQEYARNGQKHFYFMTLSSTEVIDACSKGNLGRFINHSCEPNCKTEKWMVNGEVCIGLFAIRDIAEGEEVTFDYNYVRVRGASAKKCKCGSKQCRGFIGTDSETPKDAIVESDSDEDEDPEPIMIVNSDQEDNHVDENKATPLKKQKDDAVYREPTSTRSTRIKRKLLPLKEKGPAAVKRVKTSSCARKIGSSNSKGLTVDVGVGRHEGGRALSSDVQEKLDDLLDKRGGLKKRKDVVAEYLKLLVLSVASGDNKKDASACSVRDVSLLLEALLRTSSRSVLSDIMKMNGLRMLHTFIKQLRKQWDKTPILRKLMKVLELLASDRVRVLTQSMINSAAPGRGMESFSESLFELTRHRDPEVCQMARRFRNKWIPPRPPVYEQYNKGVDKPPQLLKSVSPIQMNSSSQMQLDGNHFSSPQKQSPNGAPSKSTEGPKFVNGPSGLPGSLGDLSAQSQTGSVLTDETITRLSQGEMSLQNGPVSETEKAGSVKRKRVSRWDAPSKVEKGTYESIFGASSVDVPAGDAIPPSKRTCVPSASQIQSTGDQSQFQGPREQLNKKQRQCVSNNENGTRGPPVRSEGPVASTSGKQGNEEISVTSSCPPGSVQPHNLWQSNFPGPSTSWPPTASSGIQDSTRLPYGFTSGQPQLHSGCALGLQQRRSEPGYGIPGQSHAPKVPGPLCLPPAVPLGGLPVMPLSGPPPMMSAGALSLHSGPQQVSAANGFPPGGLPMPGTIYPGCPPPHMVPGGPTVQGLHGMGPNMAMVYPQGVHYGQWGLAPAMPHFAGPTAFPIDESRRFLPQPTWPPQNTSVYSDDGSQWTPTNGDVLASKGNAPANDVQNAGDIEPEPPVPGLSPPPSSNSNTHDSTETANQCPRDFSQEQRMPPEVLDPRRYGESYISNEVPETRREREHGSNCYRPGIPDTKDTGGGFHEEHWDDPESQSFKDHVYFLVKSRVRRHKLRTRDIDKFCTKLADVIVRKEVAKCLEHRNQGCEKIIVRSKLVEKVESYVDNQVEQFSRKCDRNYRSGDHSK